ncbi:MAG: heme lyase CcmF/NrfE family subunit [Desulfovibrio sp.]|nr:heme lyase CcmF/NrfE family subunit [Desulfovibrio sp.]
MYYFGFLSIVLAMFSSLLAALAALTDLWHNETKYLKRVEQAHIPVSLCLLLASAALLHALFWQDYALQYAANYTDRYLSLFYRLTAFWAGQPGSMLFWALATAILGSLFPLLSCYRHLSEQRRLWFWTFFHCVMAFFSLLLTCYSNPFIMQQPVPEDGNGLNPLLQNPGMIIHPPLLFIGYAGFVIPFCLALAQKLAPEEHEGANHTWFRITRPYLLFAWMFLTAGILLGAWWAYMELGWGGYWAWDPVENSSLVPWLLATALLHTLSVERTSKALTRYNILLISLTCISTFFATYLVRSGVVDSVHAFGQGTVGTPLLIFIVLTLGISIAVSLKRSDSSSLPDLFSREGLLAMMSWFLLALCAIITIATLWPVLTRMFSQTPSGLDARFYNTVCLPLAAVLLALLAFCPWISADRGKRWRLLAVIAAIFVGAGLLLAFFGFSKITALIAASASIAILAGIALKCFLLTPRPKKRSLAALGTHFGLALAGLAVAFSGPYDTEQDILLATGMTEKVGTYTLTLENIRQEDGPGYSALLAVIRIQEKGKDKGILIPERRIYEKFGDMQFSEVDTLPSLGNELYVSLLGMTQEKKVLVRFSIKPLVNWLWIGGIFMCLMPVFGIAGRFAKPQSEEVRA